jgi:alpha-L-fucosidase
MNLKSKLVLLFSALFLSAGQLFAGESVLRDILYKFHHMPDRILVASHRGAHQNYPENSLAAYREAIRIGVDILETDVRATKDGVLVIMHDKTVDRTTNGKGNVSDLTFAELRELRLLHQGSITEEVIPTLEEVLQLTKGKIMLDIDYKADKTYISQTTEAIKKAGMENQVLFFLYNYKEIPELRKVSSSTLVMPRAYSLKDMSEIIKMGNIPVIHIDPSYYKENAIKKHASQTRIWANALGKYDNYTDKDEGYTQMLNDLKYVNIIQTDYPEELIRFLETKEREKLRNIKPVLVHSEIIKAPKSIPSAHASTIVETKDGILAAWFGGSYERHPDVSIYSSRFKNGEWSEPVLVADGVQNKSLRYPCWNPVLFKRENGDLILYYKVGPSPSTWWGEYKISKDEGKTWSVMTTIPRACVGPIKNKPVIIPGGEILYPTSIEIVGKWNVYMEKSDQDLTNWKKIEIDNNQFDAIQPSVLFYKDGALQIVCRSKNKHVVESWSEDNGETWSKLMPTELPNNNSGTDAVTLANGLQIIIYNPITEGRNKLAIAGSYDGKIWEKLIDLEDQPSGEYSYPAIIQDKEGNVHAVYTYKRERIKYVQLKFD